MSSYPQLISSDESKESLNLTLTIASRLQLENSIISRVQDLNKSDCEKTILEAVEALELLAKATR